MRSNNRMDQKPYAHSRHNARGFTLIEAMAALAILSIGLVVLIRAQTFSLNSVRRITDYERAVFITENQLHWTLLELNEIEHWEDLRDLRDIDQGFEWRVEIRRADMDTSMEVEVTMLQIVATTTWPEGRGESEYQLETFYLWGEEQ